MAERIEVERIRIDGGCQPRSTMLFDVMEDYANDMARGAEFPPVIVFYDGADYWLADGYHRRQAAETLGLSDILADVRQGTRRDAILFSVSANAAHGMRRTNEDKRRAVLTLLNDPEWARWSDREIARQCAVTHPFVIGLRPKPPPTSGNDYQIDQSRTVTRNGTTYPMNTARIGVGQPGDSDDDEPPLFDNTSFARDEPSPSTELQQPSIDLSDSHLWHSLRNAVDAIGSLPSPEETVRRFPKALAHALRSEGVNAASLWLTKFAELWSEGQEARDARTEAMVQRARELVGHGAI
jgi:hypothetical protein